MSKTFAITGAGGYVGSALCRDLTASGHTVRRLSRSGEGRDRFVLGAAMDVDALRGVDVLVHVAYDFKAATWDEIEKSNVTGTLRLFDAARQAGVGTIVFISTMSAFDGCRSLYGKAKLAVEKKLSEYGGVAVRPGLIWGAQAGGMVGSLAKLAKLPLMPMVGRGNQVLYLCHESDLSQMISTVGADAARFRGSPIIAANDTPWTLKEIVFTLAGRRPAVLPVPPGLMLLGLRGIEALGVRLRVRSDSLVSLLNQDTSPDFAPTRNTGVAFRAFGSA